jgi:hypothetical protein
MKIRQFIDFKRLINICININIRIGWLTDYLKIIGKELQNSNKIDIDFQNSLSEYVNYNGQSKTIKTYIDDQVDIQGRRTLIIESQLSNSNELAGYYSGNTWQYELNDNTFNLGGYYSGGTWHKEIDTGVILGGYYSGTWKSEIISNKTIKILIHNSVYSKLNTTELQTLTNNIKRYVISPYEFTINGYDTVTTFNGSSDYIETNIHLNSTSILNTTVAFPDTTFNQYIGTLETSYMFLGVSDISGFYSAYGHSASTGIPNEITENVFYNLEINGIKQKAYKNGITTSGENYDGSYFDANDFNTSIQLGTNTYSYLNYSDKGTTITKNNITTYLTPHPEGYYFDNFGNIYYNQNSTYNEFPLSVTLNIY